MQIETYLKEIKRLKDVIESSNHPVDRMASPSIRVTEESKEHVQGMFNSDSGVLAIDNSDVTGKLISCEQLRQLITSYLKTTKPMCIYDAIAKIGALENMIKSDDERVKALRSEIIKQSATIKTNSESITV